MDGQNLYALVQQYHGLGVHRAGTAVDAATAEWMAGQLSSRGLSVERVDVPFERFAYEGTLECDGSPVAHEPLYYSWLGDVDAGGLDLRVADAAQGGRHGDIDGAVAEDVEAGRRASALGTAHPKGSLRMINRRPAVDGQHPTVLVAARDVPSSPDAVRLRGSAQLVEASTTNLIARTAAAVDADRPHLVSTPLTGWFGCAGERGTGIAVTLDLVERFAHLPLVVLATGAHELDYLGVRRWMPVAGDYRTIVHVGASVACDQATSDGTRELVPTRLALTSLDADAAGPMRDRLAAIGLDLGTATASWVGESEVFSALDRPMLSFSGAGPDFHTVEDTPSEATSPAALERVAEAIGDAMGHLVGLSEA